MYSKVLMIHGNQFKILRVVGGPSQTKLVNLRFIEFPVAYMFLGCLYVFWGCQSLRHLYVYDQMLLYISEALILFLL